MKKIALSVFISFISIITFSQSFEFRENDKDFIEDVETFIGKYDKKSAKEVSEKLKDKYAVFSASQKEIIVSFSNELVKKKIKVNSPIEETVSVEEAVDNEDVEEERVEKKSLFERWSDKFREFLDNAE